MRAKPRMTARTHDEYLLTFSADKRAALNRLRRTIKAAAPGAEECISYQIPAFRLGGKLLVAYGGAAHHCAFYPGSLAIERHARELGRYNTSKGTVRFVADKPIPAGLVKKLVGVRVAQLCGGGKLPVSKRRPSNKSGRNAES